MSLTKLIKEAKSVHTIKEAKLLGGGFGGLCMALRLESLVLLEDKRPQLHFCFMIVSYLTVKDT